MVVVPENVKQIIYIFYILLFVFFANIFIHMVCNHYLECFHWSYLFGHNLVCNACIDFAKWIKDYQFMLYGTISSLCLIQFNTYINSKQLPGNCNIPT